MDEFEPIDTSQILNWYNTPYPIETWPVISRQPWPAAQRAKMIPPYPLENIRMAAVDDWTWNGLIHHCQPIVERLMVHFPDCQWHKPWLSACMPGYGVGFHEDRQPENFVTRIHCPVITNDRARMNVSGMRYWPKVGMSYQIDTRKQHGIQNDGKQPRIHFIFDVLRKEAWPIPESPKLSLNADAAQAVG